MLNTTGRFMYAKYWGIHVLYVEHCGKICLYKRLGNIFCWTLFEDLFTQNTEKYFMLNTGKIYLHKILGNTFMLNNVGIFIDTTYWEILYVEQCGNIYLHKIL